MHCNPLLNILIRTSNRPNYFRRLIRNIDGQTYKKFRPIISADSTTTMNYIHKAGYEFVEVKHLQRSEKYSFPWNLYLNDLMARVTEGWILFMDDDDQYAHQVIFKIIADSLPDEDSMLVWKMRFPDGRLVPDAQHFGKTPFIRKQIGMPCFAFHSKHKDKVRFDGQRAGDIRFVQQLQEFLTVEWLSITGVHLDNFGNVGRPVDLVHKQINNSI